MLKFAFLLRPFLISLLAVSAFVLPAYSQSFSIATSVTQTDSQYNYVFTLSYDQAGQVQALGDNIWNWAFYVDSSLPTPTDITTPTGWKSSYDASSGQFNFYTEGPNGFGSGDFGINVILPGQSLTGFGLTTPATPDSSVAFATDVQYNQDVAAALLPGSVPAAVPESSTTVSLGLLLALGLGGTVAVRKRVRRTV